MKQDNEDSDQTDCDTAEYRDESSTETYNFMSDVLPSLNGIKAGCNPDIDILDRCDRSPQQMPLTSG